MGRPTSRNSGGIGRFKNMKRFIRTFQALLIALSLGACAHATLKSTTLFDLSAFELDDLLGAKKSLGDFRGQVVLLDFWATWCVPCKDSLPVYSDWQAELGGRGFKVIAVSVDERTDGVLEFAKKHAPNLTVLHDQGASLSEALDLETMPMAFLLNADLQIVHRHAGFRSEEAEDLRKKIIDLLEADSSQIRDSREPTAPNADDPT